MIEPLLTSVQIYRRELYREERLTYEEEQELITKARAGDRIAREDIITGCLRYVLKIAAHYRKFLVRDDIGDLIGLGNLALIENLDKALNRENPFGYLQGCAKLTIIRYCSEQKASDLHSIEDFCLPAKEAISVTKPSYSWLYQAVERLNTLQREIVYAHYGLGDRPKESLYQISLRMSRSKKGSYAYNAMYRALRKLRSELVQITV